MILILKVRAFNWNNKTKHFDIFYQLYIFMLNYVRKSVKIIFLCSQNVIKQINNVHMNRYVYILKRFSRNLHNEIRQIQNNLIWNKNGGCQWQNSESKYVQINELKYDWCKRKPWKVGFLVIEISAFFWDDPNLAHLKNKNIEKS